MGRGKRGGYRGGRGGRGGGQSTARHDVFVTDRSNAKLEEYYKKMFSEDEWESMLASFKETLPTTFRLAGSRTTAHDLNEVIKKVYIPHLVGQTWEDRPIPAPTQLPWYPEGLGWQLNVQKQIIRKSPEFRKFQNFLVYETEVGNISRQEAVSMIPPLVLDVEPHHNVLDMCAAPGSKTAQLLEALHAKGGIPSGIVIANDSDYKRSHMLVHQAARLPSPSLMVTNLDASGFPRMRLSPLPGSKNKARYLRFDRILCDVPCSGDGTLRKNFAIWKSWQPMNGNGLHSLQVRILLRAMQLLKDDGRIVYSTCSINPVENEAVLAAALNAYPGQYTILDVSDRLPGLVRRPGVTDWNVAVDKNLKMFSSWTEYQATLNEREKKETKVHETLFPPQNVKDLHLDRCMRIYPHLQDTGGFFVAVLVKTASLNESNSSASNPATSQTAQVPSSESNAPASLGLKRTASNLSTSERDGDVKRVKVDDVDEDAKDSIPSVIPPVDTSVVAMGENGEERVSQSNTSFNESPYTFLPADNHWVKICTENLSIIPEFPAHQLFLRSPDGDNPRAMYLSNALVREIVLNNDYNRIRLINCGVKVFLRQENGQNGGRTFRFVDDGTETILPFVKPTSVLTAGIQELKKMLETYYPFVENFEEDFRNQIQGKPVGSYLIKFNTQEWEGATLRHPLILPFWISGVSTSLMTDKKAKSALSLRLFGEDITPSGKEAEKQKGQKVAIPSGETTSQAAAATEEEQADMEEDRAVEDALLMDDSAEA